MFFSAEFPKFSEMKSIQLYSTKDEYIYAMKEDLAEWFNSMYSTQLTAENFIDKLENGVIICQHANNVTKAALDNVKFDQTDLNKAGIINIPIESHSNINRLLTPNGKSNWSGNFLLFRSDARPQSFQSRDNISNFIKWCRYIAKVRECLMFETEDLILRKNEKNFILCLLEIARFGSKFGIQIPTIIQLEQEIEAEIEREIERSQAIESNILKYNSGTSDTENHSYAENIESEKIIYSNRNDLPNIINKFSIDFLNDNSRRNTKSLTPSRTNDESNKKIKNGESLANSSFDVSFGINNDINLNENITFLSDSLENLDISNKKIKNKSIVEQKKIDLNKAPKDLASVSDQKNRLPSSSSSSASFSSNSSIFNQNEDNINNNTYRRMEEFILDKKNIHKNNSKKLISIFRREAEIRGKIEQLASQSLSNIVNPSQDHPIRILSEKNNKKNESFSHNYSYQEVDFDCNLANLDNHVCSIADRCKCEKQFPVIKIGEGKYRIGNTKNIVFIRILRNHIMVRVGGGWDTLENFLNKHDPCRCSGNSNDSIAIKLQPNESTYLKEQSTYTSNILVTPIQHSSFSPSILQKNQAKYKFDSKCFSTNSLINKKELDFTDAKLVVERDTQGKHIVGKIIVNKLNDQNKPKTSDQSLYYNSIFNYCQAKEESLNEILNIQMDQNSNSLIQNQIVEKNSLKIFNSQACKTNIPSNSMNSLNQCLSNQNIKRANQSHKTKNSINDDYQLTLMKDHSRIFKTNINDFSSNPTTTGYSSLNEDYSSSDFLEKASFHGVNKIKSRVIKKYDKKRAITEAIIDLEKINQTNDSISNSVKVTSSPKPPPRNKKKYRKSKTTDIKQLDLSIKKPDFESILNQNEDSLEESEYESSESLQNKIKIEKLNDSLESINLTLNNDIKVEDDSLLFNNDHCISLSLSTTSSISNFYEIDQEHEFSNVCQKIGRAQWDKSSQKLEFKTQHFASPPTSYINQNNTYSISNFNKNQAIINSISFSDSTSKFSKKTNNNLKFAKEQLYEMKKTIDAKINLKDFEKPKSISLAVRTTPRKVKKRSIGRSVTTGIIKEMENKTTNQLNQKLSRKKSITSMIPKTCQKINLTSNSKQTSSSLHNLNNCFNNPVSKPRRESSVSSSRTCLSNNVSFSSINTTPVEFKENKAFELRKKSIFLNKIVTKNNQRDPIYSRSHPISNELSEKIMNSTLSDNIPSRTTNSTIRKRLFSKKGENKIDLNLSIGSNGSCNSTPVATNFILRNKILASSPIINKLKSGNLSVNINKKKNSPLNIKQSSRSKSNTDLFYELERSNSAQDLIELINDCDPPAGDLTKYKVLINECENYDPKSKKNKKNNNTKKPTKLINDEKIQKEKSSHIVDEKNNIDSIIKIHHKRSRSLPLYKYIPLINQKEDKKNNETFDEEYHEETYWEDIKSNF